MNRPLSRAHLFALAAICWTLFVGLALLAARRGHLPFLGESEWFALLALIGGFGAMLAMDAIIRGRVDDLCERIREVRARAQFDTQIEISRTSEFTELCSEINSLLATLQRSREQLRSLNAELERRVAERTAEVNAGKQAMAEDAARRIAEVRAHAERERVYRAVHDLSPVGILQESEDGRIVEINESLCEMLGYTREELIGKPIQMLADPARHAEIAHDIRRLLNGESLLHEVPNLRKDGSRRMMELRERAITLPDGRRRIVVVASDITDRKAAEERLRESEQRYHTLFNTLITGFALHEIICDEKGTPVDYRFLDVNPAFTAMTGKCREEVVGRRVKEVFPGLEQEWITRYGQVALTQKPVAFEQFSGPLKKYFSVIAFSPQPGQFAVNFIDVTEQHRASDMIRLQGAALESAANGIMLVDREGTITWVNKAFTELTGYTREEAIGQRPNLLKSGRQSKAFYRQLWDTVLAGRLWRGELYNRRKDGSLYLEELTITPVLAPDGTPTHFVAIKQDITERRNLQRQLMEAQKMETIGRLAGGIAHDFNNLLQAITGFSHLLLENMDARNPHRDDVLEIDKAAKRASELTRQLLAFSRRQMIETRTVDLNALVESTQKMLRRLIGEDIELTLSLEPRLDPVRVDPGQIEQVLVNLTVNARDAMQSGGRLTISTSSIVLLKEDDIFTPDRRHGRFVVLDVTDTGPGMTPEVKERIFEPFFTTKGPGRGTGLGLSVVYGIIQQHEGMIHVYSEVGQGTTFRIYLPVSLESATEAATPTPESESEQLPRGRHERILLVEDEPGVRDFALSALRKYGYQPFVAENAAAAELLFTEIEGRIDLLFSDVVLPDQTGLELAASLRAKKPDLRLLLTSGYMDEKSRWPIIRDRGYPFLQKPYPLDNLLRTVRQVLDQPPPPA